MDMLVMFHVMVKNIDSNDCLIVENDDVEGFEELQGVEEGTELIEDQVALD